jgi:hypothetical protein
LVLSRHRLPRVREPVWFFVEPVQQSGERGMCKDIAAEASAACPKTCADIFEAAKTVCGT